MIRKSFSGRRKAPWAVGLLAILASAPLVVSTPASAESVRFSGSVNRTTTARSHTFQVTKAGPIAATLKH